MIGSEQEGLKEKIERLEGTIQHLNSKVQERQELEKQLQQAQKMKALASLAGGIAHDFNNILQAILGYTQLALMQKEEQHPDYKTFAGIETIIKRGSALTDQFLRIGRKMQPKFAPMNINTAIIETRRLLRRTIPKMIDVKLELADNLKLINADTGQIEQVLINLSINARDAMSGKGILLLKTDNIELRRGILETHRDIPPGDYIRLTVADTGCGMPPETLAQVFEPFFTAKETGDGTGLGLAMVQAIVKNHGGYIDCSSRVGKGTVFKLYFPVLKQEPHRADSDKEEKKRSNGGKETILVVDDEVDILKIGKAVLQKFGYTVITAKNGEEAVQVFSRKTVDSVILDVGMPGMGGIDCLKNLLAIDQQAKVLISSGYVASNYVEEALNLGAKAFLSKPYRIQHLLETVREVLDNKEPALAAMMD